MRIRTALLLVGAAIIVAACTERPAPRPPDTEFLVSAGDSTYWVRPAADGMRLRGSPILLARFDGRFHEVYVTDDDRSYEDAAFVGQRVWRRDLVRGDSVLVFEDTIVPRLARQWAADHEDARLLGSSEEAPEEPAASAMVDVVVVDVHGPYLSYEYHADVEGEDERPWHTTRRGVVDLRSGRPVSAAQLFGNVPAQRAITAARRRYVAAVDSLLQAAGTAGDSLATSLDKFEFDATSFSIGGDAATPTIEFFVPGRGEGRAGDVALPLEPIDVPAPRWWSEVRNALPRGDAAEPSDEWSNGRYAVRAEYGDAGARLVVQDPQRRRWPVGIVQTPVHQVHWLDTPPVDSTVRRGLRRAFDEAAFYDGSVRTASFQPRPRPRRRHEFRPARLPAS